MTTTARDREKMANQLMMRGHATVEEILTANFGEWPPRGLEIIGHNNQSVKLTSIFDQGNEKKPFYKRAWENICNGLTRAGDATLGGPRIIRMNRGMSRLLSALMVENGINSTLGHEATHIMQGDHYWRADRIFKPHDAHEIWGAQQDATSNEIVDPLFEQHQKGGRLRKIFNSVAKFVYDDIDYQKQGIEIQARLHEIMMAGYPAWGRLPSGRVELMTAVADAGFPMPDDIRRRLDKVPDIEETRAEFSGARKHGPLPSGLTFMYSNLTDEGKNRFWLQTLPALYSDLIEMYGDGPGRARFNLGVNPRAAYRTRSDLLREPPADKAAGM